MGFSLVVTSGSYFLVAVRGLHIVVASPVVEHGIEPLSPALAGKFLTTEPPGTLVTQFLIKTFKYLYTHTHTHTHTYIYMYIYIYMGKKSE